MRSVRGLYIGVVLGLYRDNGKENGNYHSIIGLYIGVNTAIMEKKMETTTVLQGYILGVNIGVV